MIAAKGQGLAKALILVLRPNGATAADVHQALSCHKIYGHQVLKVLMVRHGCVRVKHRGVWRYFDNDRQLQGWLEHQLNVEVANIVIARRVPPCSSSTNDLVKTAEITDSVPSPARVPEVTACPPIAPKAGQRALITKAPEVPGWGSSGPFIREGAMDFKRYQHPASLAFTGSTQ